MTTATLPRKVAFRAEHTGSAPQDRAQRMAQQVGTAHEQTKGIVSALANQAYTALAVDSTTTSATYATLLTTTITTVLPNGHLVITFTASAVKTVAAGFSAFKVLLDGVALKGTYVTSPAGAPAFSASIMVRAAVTAGLHTVIVQWKTSTNGTQINAATVVEEHAHLLVQESL